ncbi:HEAT repeat domain-containing protein, partial [bacterium]|nr:HEAT repeat domain-containing protein [bacterium]
MGNRLEEIGDRLQSPDPYIRELAIKELTSADSHEAILLLLGKLEDDEWRIRKLASKLIVDKGKITIPVLKEKLKYNNNDDFVYWSCQILSEFGIPSVPLLTHFLKSDKNEHKYYAVMALNNIDDKKIIDILINCLSDSYWLVRKEAAEGLEKFGNFAISKLKNYVSSGNKDLRYWTIKLIGKILKESAVDILIKAMNHKDKEMRYHTVIALGEANNEKAIPILIKALSDSSWLVRKQAAECIVDYDELAVKYLQEAFKKGNADVKYWTIKLFGKILKDSGVEYLNKILTESSETDMRYYAITALGEVRTSKAIITLIDALKDESWTLRRHIANVLKKMGAIVIPVIKKFIYKEHKDEDILYWSSNVLSELGVESIDSLEQ